MKPLTRNKALVNAYVEGTLDKVKPLTRNEAFRKMELEKSSTVIVHLTGSTTSGLVADMNHREVCDLVKRGMSVICEYSSDEEGTLYRERMYLTSIIDALGTGELFYTFETLNPVGLYVEFIDSDAYEPFRVGTKVLRVTDNKVKVFYESLK